MALAYAAQSREQIVVFAHGFLKSMNHPRVVDAAEALYAAARAPKDLLQVPGALHDATMPSIRPPSAWLQDGLGSEEGVSDRRSAPLHRASAEVAEGIV